MSASLCRSLQGDWRRLDAALLSLGGCPLEASGGRHVWQIPLLPKIPAQVHCLDADEEFPFEMRVLYDEYAGKYLEFECLAFLNGAFLEAVQNALPEG